jgi:hypothetical protein
MIQNPTIEIKGTLNKAFKKSFTNQKKEVIEYHQVCLLTGNEFYPLMYLSCTPEVFSELDDEKNTGLDFIFSGTIDQNSQKTETGYRPVLKIRIDDATSL